MKGKQFSDTEITIKDTQQKNTGIRLQVSFKVYSHYGN